MAQGEVVSFLLRRRHLVRDRSPSQRQGVKEMMQMRGGGRQEEVNRMREP